LVRWLADVILDRVEISQLSYRTSIHTNLTLTRWFGIT
jgi:hypothetical protein